MATTDSPKPRTRGTRRPLINLPAPATEHDEQIANLAALLSNPEGVKLSARVAELEAQTAQQGRVVTGLQTAKKDLEDKLAIAQTQLRHAQEENKGLTTERDAMTTERDGYASELKIITEEANKQRKAADDAKAGVKVLTEKLEVLQIDLNVSHAANEGLRSEAKHAARLVPILGALLLIGGLAALALWIASMGGVK